jgi:hypothetical protein
MHRLDSHHFMPAYLCAHRPQSRTAIRHSFCSTLFDSLMDPQIELMAEDLRHNRRNSCRRSAASYG